MAIGAFGHEKGISICIFPDFFKGTVTYGANAIDKAGNRAWTGYKSFAVIESEAKAPIIHSFNINPTQIRRGQKNNVKTEAY